MWALAWAWALEGGEQRVRARTQKLLLGVCLPALVLFMIASLFAPGNETNADRQVPILGRVRSIAYLVPLHKLAIWRYRSEHPSPWQDSNRQPSSLDFHRPQRQTPAVLHPIAFLVSLACHQTPRGHLSGSRYHSQQAIAPISSLPHLERCFFPARPPPPPFRPSLPFEPPTHMPGLSCPEAP
jgi:hypothetical protein